MPSSANLNPAVTSLYFQVAGNPNEWTAVYFDQSSMPVDNVVKVIVEGTGYSGYGFYLRNVCGHMCFPVGKYQQSKNLNFVNIKSIT